MLLGALSLAEIALLVTATGGLVTAVVGAFIKVHQAVKKDPSTEPVVNVSEALKVFNDLVEVQAKDREQMAARLNGAEDRIDELEERVQKCEDQKIELRKQLEAYRRIAEDIRFNIK